MNDKLSKIAQILGLALSSNSEVIELSTEAKLQDGTMVYTEADAFVVGAIVEVVAEDGSKSLAPVGEHILEDGSTVVVDEAGVILEIKPAMEDEASDEAEVIVEEEMSEEVSEEEVIEDEVKEFMVSEEEYSALLDRVAQLEEVLLGAVEALNSSNKTLTETVEKLSAQPAAEPIKRKIPVKENNALAGLKLGKK
jgi:hypothetical protein